MSSFPVLQCFSASLDTSELMVLLVQGPRIVIRTAASCHRSTPIALLPQGPSNWESGETIKTHFAYEG